jgi:hypothetical protein
LVRNSSGADAERLFNEIVADVRVGRALGFGLWALGFGLWALGFGKKILTQRRKGAEIFFLFDRQLCVSASLRRT